jgi:hypothetical protein
MMESTTTIHHTNVREYSIRIVSGHGYIRIVSGHGYIRILSGHDKH